MATSGDDLILAMRENSDNVNDNFIEDSQWLRLANEAIAWLYDLLVLTWQQYNVTKQPFALTTTNTLDLSALDGGFYKEVGVDWFPTGNTQVPVVVPPLDNFTDRDRANERRYFISQQTLTIYPGFNYSGNYVLWYTPDPPVLADGTATIPREMERWKEMITLKGAIMARIKKEQPTAELETRLTEQVKRIEVAASQRKAEPAQIPMRKGDYDSVARNMFGGWWGLP